MAPYPYHSIQIKVSLMDGHYLILLEHVNDVIKEFDGFENIRHISPLRDLVLALLGYKKEPFRMYISSIPKFGCCEILNALQKLLDGWMSIYTTSALSPCSKSETISLESQVVRVSWSRVDRLEFAFRFSEKSNHHSCFDISVHSTELGSDEYHINFLPSSTFLFGRFRQEK
jgi:hypothetical protein